jgi:hypothetical protein
MPLILSESGDSEGSDSEAYQPPSYIGLMLQPTYRTRGQFARLGLVAVNPHGPLFDQYDVPNTHPSAVDLVKDAFLHSSIRKVYYQAYDGEQLYTVHLV